MGSIPGQAAIKLPTVLLLLLLLLLLLATTTHTTTTATATATTTCITVLQVAGVRQWDVTEHWSYARAAVSLETR